MKRPFNIFDAFFVMAVVFKLTGTGLQVAWWAMLLPYAVEALFVAIGALATLFSWREKIKFWFWNAAMKWRVKQAGKNARAMMHGIAKENEAIRAVNKAADAKASGSNPGQFIDPQKLGKQ